MAVVGRRITEVRNAVHRDRLLIHPSIAKPLERERRDVDACRLAVQNQFGHQLSSHGPVHKAVATEATRQKESLNFTLRKDRVVIGRDVVETRPPPYDLCLCQDRDPVCTCSPDLRDDFPVDCRIETRVPIGWCRDKGSSLLSPEVPASLDVDRYWDLSGKVRNGGGDKELTPPRSNRDLHSRHLSDKTSIGSGGIDHHRRGDLTITPPHPLDPASLNPHASDRTSLTNLDPEIARPLTIAPDYLKGRGVPISPGVGPFEEVVDSEARDKALDLGRGEDLHGNPETPLEFHASSKQGPLLVGAEKEEIAGLPEVRIPPHLLPKGVKHLQAFDRKSNMDLGKELAPDTPRRTARRATAKVSLFQQKNFETGIPCQMVGDTTPDDASPDDADVYRSAKRGSMRKARRKHF